MHNDNAEYYYYYLLGVHQVASISLEKLQTQCCASARKEQATTGQTQQRRSSECNSKQVQCTNRAPLLLLTQYLLDVRANVVPCDANEVR